jgi:hypothetical protein
MWHERHVEDHPNIICSNFLQPVITKHGGRQNMWCNTRTLCRVLNWGIVINLRYIHNFSQNNCFAECEKTIWHLYFLHPVSLPLPSLYDSKAIWTSAHFFSFLILYTVGRTPWTGDHPLQCRNLHTGQHKPRIHAQRHQCLKWESNPRPPMFEPAKTVRALDSAATVIDFHPVVLRNKSIIRPSTRQLFMKIIKSKVIRANINSFAVSIAQTLIRWWFISKLHNHWAGN